MVKNLPQTCLHSHSYLKLITDRLRKIGKRKQRKKHRKRKGEIQGAEGGIKQERSVGIRMEAEEGERSLENGVTKLM